MTIISIVRDIIAGLTRGFGVYLGERNDFVGLVASPRMQNRKNCI